MPCVYSSKQNFSLILLVKIQNSPIWVATHFSNLCGSQYAITETLRAKQDEKGRQEPTAATTMGDGFLRAALALSAAGTVSLPLFALLLRLQPQFVHGLRADAMRAERNCLLGGACYAGVFLASLAILCARSRRRHVPSDSGGARTAYDKHYNLPFGEHANDEFATAMKALDARRSPALVVQKDAQLAVPTEAPRQARGDLQYT